MIGWASCQSMVRSSATLVLILVFLDLFTDSLLLTLVDPILPDIIARLDNETVESKDEELSSSINFNGRYGYLVAAKGGTQFICNPFVGYLVTKVGYRVPMLFGNFILAASTIAFAYGPSYWFLFVTRMLQGASSSVTAVTGMGLLAATYTDNDQRGKVMGIAIGGLSLGIIFGPVYGSVLYQFVSRQMPFLIVAGMVGVCIVLQLLTLRADQKSHSDDYSGLAIFKLLVDPYILVVAGNIFILNLDVSVVLAFLPIRLIDLENPEPWKLGIVVLPTSVGYLLASLIFPRVTAWFPRWLSGLTGLLVSGFTLLILAVCSNFLQLLIVTTFLGVALGMVSTAMQPIFAYLVDIRHSTVYGNVYAISDMAVCLAMFTGPMIGGPIYYSLGFMWLVVGVAVINISFAQFSLMLRNPPPREYQLEEVEEYEEKYSLLKAPSVANSHQFSMATGTSNSSFRSTATMDISHIPVPRYLVCLSAAEDLCTDTESLDGPCRTY